MGYCAPGDIILLSLYKIREPSFRLFPDLLLPGSLFSQDISDSVNIILATMVILLPVMNQVSAT